MAKDTLNARQERFVREYLVDRNGTAAAERAGYTGTKAGLAVTASRLLREPKIASRVAAGETRLAEATGLSAERVLAEVARLALADPAQAFNPDGTLKPLHEIPEDLRRTLAGVELTAREDGARLTKVRFWDKNSALEKLMKHLGLLKDKVEHTGAEGAPLQIVVNTYREGT